MTTDDREIPASNCNVNFNNTLFSVPMHDLALIVLSTEVAIIEGIIETIPLMDAPYEEGSTVTVIGWGVDSTDDADRDEYGYLDTAETLQELPASCLHRLVSSSAQ